VLRRRRAVVATHVVTVAAVATTSIYKLCPRAVVAAATATAAGRVGRCSVLQVLRPLPSVRVACRARRARRRAALPPLVARIVRVPAKGIVRWWRAAATRVVRGCMLALTGTNTNAAALAVTVPMTWLAEGEGAAISASAPIAEPTRRRGRIFATNSAWTTPVVRAGCRPTTARMLPLRGGARAAVIALRQPTALRRRRSRRSARGVGSAT
jgi:hypothetical protein